VQRKGYFVEDTSTDIDLLLEELYAFGRSEGGMWNVGREGGALLAWFIKILDAERVLEIGTSNGVSTIWMARALQETGGQLVTLEVEPRKVALATENLKRAGLFEIVTIIEGPAIQSLEALGGEFDLVFIDADKPQYPDYLSGVRDKVRPGSIIVADNVSKSNETSQPYRDAVAADDGLDSVGLSIAGGFWVSRVH
jgi:predicted O-methyltransferase YrrM